MTVKELKKGEFFTLLPLEYPKESQVFIRGEYDRTSKKYECQKFSDINAFRYFKANTVVFTEFIF